MYLLFKAFHLIGMVTWFAGLFYMFRLFVYWVENKDSNEAAPVLKTMSHKLFFYITTPSMIVTLVMGFSLISLNVALLTQLWLQIKLSLIFLLVSYHLYIGYTLGRFKQGDYFLTSKQCRLINEIPVVFLVSIVILAVLRPFL